MTDGITEGVERCDVCKRQSCNCKILHKLIVKVKQYELTPTDELENEINSIQVELESLIEDGKKWRKYYDTRSFMTLEERDKLESQITTLTKKYDTSIEEYNKLSQKCLGLTSQNFDLESQNKQLEEKIEKYDFIIDTGAEQIVRDANSYHEYRQKNNVLNQQLELAKTVINEIEKHNVINNAIAFLERRLAESMESSTRSACEKIIQDIQDIKQILQKWSGVEHA